ncbi:sulfate/molybdate ABC transporter ATP-binding protein [Larkinella insperata]|uniref:Sulfate/molybdate ABC transporter ATP-binding protein n=1 Tax=Larkinella insperata TaxID=332158 RepID=A0ABW3Q736_9BACT|nr:ABC transporter ATP-binding protein [Larkinella insperata]
MGDILMPTIRLHARMNLLFASGPAPLDVDFTLKAGSLTGLYGPSGSGKTTLLRILAGLTGPETGIIQVGDQIWLDTSRRINVPTQQRNVGMVFQDAALFPNMTVRENVQYAAENRRDPIVDELLELAGLMNLAGRKPASLSGGQRQRVALIRALARRPRMLLLDEPFSALDVETREQLLAELVRLHQRFGTTTVLVSHHQEEIQRVADQVIRLEQGKAYLVEPALSARKKDPLSVHGVITALRTEAGLAQIQIQVGNERITLEVPLNTSEWQPGQPVMVSITSAAQVRKMD